MTADTAQMAGNHPCSVPPSAVQANGGYPVAKDLHTGYMYTEMYRDRHDKEHTRRVYRGVPGYLPRKETTPRTAPKRTPEFWKHEVERAMADPVFKASPMRDPTTAAAEWFKLFKPIPRYGWVMNETTGEEVWKQTGWHNVCPTDTATKREWANAQIKKEIDGGMPWILRMNKKRGQTAQETLAMCDVIDRVYGSMDKACKQAQINERELRAAKREAERAAKRAAALAAAEDDMPALEQDGAPQPSAWGGNGGNWSDW